MTAQISMILLELSRAIAVCSCSLRSP